MLVLLCCCVSFTVFFYAFYNNYNLVVKMKKNHYLRGLKNKILF